MLLFQDLKNIILGKNNNLVRSGTETNSVTSEQETGAENITWNLSDLYKGIDDSQLMEDREWLVEEADHFAKSYKGKVAELNANQFYEALKKYESILEILHRMGAFAHLQWTTNTGDSAYGKLLQDITELSSTIQQKLVFFDVEWLKLDEEEAHKIIEHHYLQGYRHFLETSRRYKQHTLEENQEQIMSAKSVSGRQAWVRYFDETLGAARFEIDGEKVTEQEALSKMHSPDRETRKKAHQALTETFKDLSRTLTFVFNTLLADKHTNDKLRNYPSWISARNLDNEIEDEAVDALINSVTGQYGLVQRYYKLKKKLLNYDELYDYDRYAPLLANEKTYTWHEARDIILSAYESFHPKLAEVANKFFENNWIDAAVREGKRGGAFSASTVPSAHPYIMVNFTGQIRDVQTLAHELGHGVHQYLSRDQGLLEADTPLTTAETASVFGEMLVFNHLMQDLDDPKERLALLMGKIDDSIATVFRQISMNRFENAIHTERREEGELTKERFSELWRSTQKDLYGDSITLTSEYSLWWSYIPHFLHVPGYVYAYAFGELLVLALYETYRQTDNPSVFTENYLEVLRAGGSDWPENIIGRMGMDINDPEFWNQGLNSILKLVEQAEDLAADVNL